MPLAAKLTGANRHDVTQLIPLVDAIPPVRGKPGAPLRKPRKVMGDRAYDSDPHRMKLSGRAIATEIARRNTPHGSGLRAGGLGAQISGLTDFNGTLVFAASDGYGGIELWKSDGTAAGTEMVKDIEPGRGSSNPAQFTVVGPTLYFTASSAASGTELWKSDGTAAGTTLVSDINPGTGSSSPADLTAYGDKLLFLANDGKGQALWVTAGTAAATAKLPTPSVPGWLAAVNDQVLFTATDAAHGSELWATDGSIAGTRLLRDIDAGASGSNPTPLVGAGARLFFAADDGFHGSELWKTDGKAANTLLAADLNAAAVTNATMATNLVTGAGRLFYNSASLSGLYTTDGTPDGTSRIGQVQVSAGVTVANVFYFQGTVPGNIAQNGLWRSDGTAQGTSLVMSFRSGPDNLTVFNNALYFGAAQSGSTYTLWKSDGTAAGTTPVLPPAPSDLGLLMLAVAGNQLFYYSSAQPQPGLYKTDGTAAGSVLVKGGLPASRSDIAFGSRLLFTMADGNLWVSDGTAAGTLTLTGQGPNTPKTIDPGDLAVTPDAAYFIGPDASGTVWLARTDGTPSGTSGIVKLAGTGTPWPIQDSFTQLTAFGNDVLISQQHVGSSSADLLISDGTAAGTAGIHRFYSVQGLGDGPTFPQPVTVLGGRGYFGALDSTTSLGGELWGTDGTASGTFPEADLNPGLRASFPSSLVTLGGSLYFLAGNGSTQQLYKLAPSSAPPATPQGLAATAVTPFQAQLSWQPAADDVGTYRLERSTTGDFSDVEESWLVAGNSTGFSDEVTQPGVAVYYRLTALNDAGSAAAGTAYSAPYPNWQPGVTTLDPQLPNVQYRPVAAYRDQLFYFAFVGQNSAVVRTDGTDSTAIFQTSSPYITSIGVSPDGRYLQFSTGTGQGGGQSWVSDGTAQGTVPALPPLLGSSAPAPAPQSTAVAAGPYQFYVGTDAQGVQQLFRTDGTQAGTVQLTHVSALPGGSVLVGGLLSALGRCFFDITSTSATGASTYGVYASDGTTQGTVKLASNIALGADPIAAGNTVFFSSTNSLFATDGTVAGTRVLRNFGTYPNASDIPQIVATDGRIYFSTLTPGPGLPGGGQGYVGRLWTSDGTAAGTVELRLPISSPVEADSPGPLIPVLGSVYVEGDMPNYLHGLFLAVASDSTPSAPATPVFVTATTPGGNEIDIAWQTASANADGYVLDRSESPSFATIDRSVIVPGDIPDYADTRVTKGTTYYYRVRAYNAGGSSPEGFANPITDPDTPDDPSGFSASAVDGHTIQLTWVDHADNAAGLVLQRSRSPNFTAVEATFTLGADTTGYTDSGLDRLTTYYYRLDAFNDQGRSAILTARATTPDVAPAAPDGLAAFAVSGSEIDLQWLDNANNEAGYRVERAATGETFSALAQLPANSTTYADVTATPGVPYRYRVVAFNPIGESPSNEAGPVTSTPPRLDSFVHPFAYAPRFLTEVNGVVYFGSNGLWRTDGTAADTVEIAPQDPLQMTAVNGQIYFVAGDFTTGQQIWTSDGTTSGTHMVKRLFPGFYTTTVMLGEVGGELYFVEGPNPLALFKTDGTDAGTVQVSTVQIQQLNQNTYYGVSGGMVYFPAAGPTNVTALYRSDGTAAGTLPLSSTDGRLISGNVQSLTDVSGTLFFSGSDVSGRAGLWRTDGSSGQAVLLKQATVTNLVSVGTSVYFYCDSGPGLWVTDGTVAGTRLVASGAPEPYPYLPHPMVAVDGTIYYLTGGSLWKSDGATAGTPVAPVRFPTNVNPDVTIFGAGSLVFYSDGINLWRSDGTLSGTYEVGPIDNYAVVPQGVAYQLTSPAVVLGNSVLFDSYTAAPDGTGLYSLALTAPGAPGSLSVQGTPGGVQLSWTDDSNNETGFAIERSSAADFSAIDRVFYAAAGATSYLDSTGSQGSTYYYRVRAYNAGGYSAYAAQGPADSPTASRPGPAGPLPKRPRKPSLPIMPATQTAAAARAVAGLTVAPTVTMPPAQQAAAGGVSTVTFDGVNLFPGVPVSEFFTGDFNHDGRADVLGVDANGHHFVFFQGSGDGTFENPVLTPLGNISAGNGAVVDVNGDHIPDLLLGEAAAHTVDVFLGNGDGTFEAPVAVSLPSTPAQIAVGDFNGDGRADFVVTFTDQTALGVMIQTTTGTFQAAASVSLPAQAFTITVGDFNGDGKTDVLTAGFDSDLHLLTGKGDGTFTVSAISVPGASYHAGLAVGDFNGDGLADIAVTSLVGQHPLVQLLGTAKGAWGAPTDLSGLNGTLAVANLTNDGYDDLLDTSSNSTTVGAVFTGGAAGLTRAVAQDNDFESNYRLATADFNEDGLTDAVSFSNNAPLLVLVSNPLASAQGAQIQGEPLNTTVATFTDNLLPADPSRISAKIGWGDGQQSTGTVVSDGSGAYHVLASHTYLFNGNFNYTVTLTEQSDSRTQTAQGTVALSSGAPGAASITEFPISGGAQPGHIVAGTSGQLWFEADQGGPKAGQFDPATGTINLYSLQGPQTGPESIATDSAGNLWVINANNSLARVTPAGQVSYFTSPLADVLARGPDGNVWFPILNTQTGTDDQLGHVSPDGTIATVALDHPLGGGALAMTLGPDGNFWVSESALAIARVSPAGHVTEFPVFGPAGSNVAAIRNIVPGPDNTLWFTEADAEANTKAIGKITTDGVVIPVPFPRGDPAALALGPDGAMWFTEYNGDRIVRIAQGLITEYPVPNGNLINPGQATGPYGITAAPDGNLYFTELFAGQIGRVRLANTLQLTPKVFQVTGGMQFNGPLLSFTAPGTPAVGDFSASINWGDGATGDGAVTASNGTFTLSGSHTFSASGSQSITITINVPGDVPETAYLLWNVPDQPLTLVSTPKFLSVVGADSGSTTLLTFSDADPNGNVGQFSATADWGDGTFSAGAVQPAGNGQFAVIAGHRYQTTGTFPVKVEVVDAGGSTLPANLSASVVRPVLLQPPTDYGSITAVGAADANGDHSPDLVGVVAAGGIVLPDNGDGTFGAAIHSPPTPLGGLALMGDLNGDGQPDLVSSGSPATVLLGNGDGTFRPAPQTPGLAFNSYGALADFNGDGKLDFVTSTSPTSFAVALGNGDGTFRLSTLAIHGLPTAIVAADFNGDGKIDLAIPHTRNGGAPAAEVELFPGNGDGTFATAAFYALPDSDGGFFTASGEVNGDGKPDLVAADWANDAITVLLNKGDGTFLPASTSPAETNPPSQPSLAALSLADMNGDGNLDLVLTDSGDQSVRVRLGRGDGTFLPEAVFHSGRAGESIVTADFNRDGLPDLAVADNGFTSVLLGTAFASTPRPLSATEGSAVTSAPLVTFVGAITGQSPDSFTASVDWGDATNSAGTIGVAADGSFTISGSHVYTAYGTYQARVTVRSSGGAIVGSAIPPVVVSDAPITLHQVAVTGVAGVQETAIVARFTDSSPYVLPSQFTATMSWANGQAAPAVVQADGSGGFVVIATGTVPAPGQYPGQVTVKHSGGANASATVTLSYVPLSQAQATIRGLVFNDVNTDGVREAGEPSLFAQTVFLDVNDNGVPDPAEPSALSAADGTYALVNVPEGNYMLRLAAPPGYQVTTPLDSTAVPVSLVGGQIVNGMDLGAAALTTNVVGRHVFYNNSGADGNDPAANTADDAAIAPDKQALRPGHTASASNLTAFAAGLNGIMVDVSNLPGIPTAADFAFAVGTGSDPSTWRPAPPPTSVTVRQLPGHASRVTIVWPDNAIQNEWLRVGAGRVLLRQPDRRRGRRRDRWLLRPAAPGPELRPPGRICRARGPQPGRPGGFLRPVGPGPALRGFGPVALGPGFGHAAARPNGGGGRPSNRQGL